jgi:hypothetical protein
MKTATAGCKVDEGTIDYQRGQWEAQAGLQYLTYGVYYSHFITDPMLLDLGETPSVAALVGYHLAGEVVARGYLYNGDPVQVNGTGDAYDDHLNGWGLSVDGMVTDRWGFAVGYRSNLADTGADLSETYHRRVGGMARGLVGALGGLGGHARRTGSGPGLAHQGAGSGAQSAPSCGSFQERLWGCPDLVLSFGWTERGRLRAKCTARRSPIKKRPSSCSGREAGFIPRGAVTAGALRSCSSCLAGPSS